MKISVIIPVYNAEKVIERTIESIVNQNYSNYEVILVDDGSNDNSYEIIKKISKKYKNIFAYTKKNEGPGMTRLFGLKKATGELLYFLDSDDWITSNDSLYYINDIFTKNPEIDFLIYDREDLIRNNSSRLIAFENITPGLHEITDINEMIRAGLGAKIFKKSIMDNVPFADTNIYEDLYTTYLYLDKSSKFFYTNKILYTVFHDGVSQTLSNLSSFIKLKQSTKIVIELYNILENKNLKKCLEYNMRDIFLNYIKMLVKNNKKISIETRKNMIIIASILDNNPIKYKNFVKNIIYVFLLKIFIITNKKVVNNDS